MLLGIYVWGGSYSGGGRNAALEVSHSLDLNSYSSISSVNEFLFVSVFEKLVKVVSRILCAIMLSSQRSGISSSSTTWSSDIDNKNYFVCKTISIYYLKSNACMAL